ncbi:YbfB/YjiJ family MFS transporter [Oceanospirillum beijerinckii]|uniref:YbfB/YjiJ family MFS transporter n=1 Tax=Oceanospirillum beijerinckii TaxID=64976 RepID=UPI0003FA3B29|nr:YbfB/YjiJ family MFS transporter [Oceanospirillum beijerinckii]
MTPSKVTEPLDDGAVQMARIRVLLAGICTFIVTVGVARFSYTSLLPVMQAETWLTEASAGWLAASIYIGYMCGVLLAASTNSLARKYYFLRLYLVLSVLTSWGMALSDDIIVWSMLRFVAGICGSGALILASGLILKWLIKNGHRGELGVHFAGAGVSIVGTALLVEWMAGQSMSWQSQWIGFSVMAAIFAIPAWLWMPHPGEDHAQQNGAAAQDKAPARAFFLLMLAAYFCAGYGYVVSATFIVDIVERQDGLAGQGQMIFMWIGIAAIPAVIIWDRVARRVGYIRALVMAYLLQVVGIVMPAFTDSMAGAVFSALLFGGTFIACVSLVLTMAGHMYPSNPAKMMGKMTLAYGVAQILAPMLTGMLAQQLGDYYLGLYLAAGVVFAGSLLLLLLLQLENRLAPALA